MCKLFDIQRNSFVDGPGIRTTVFFMGCNLRCEWCHNPESQTTESKVLYYAEKCIGCNECASVCEKDAIKLGKVNYEKCNFCGSCVVVCPKDAIKLCGKKYTIDELLEIILKDKLFYDNSGGGVTFSGGECMLYPDYLVKILKLCKENGINTAVDTAGNVPWESFRKVIPYTDLFLYDVKCFESDKHKHFTGTGNELILENLIKLSENNCNIWVRIPVIPSVNDTPDEMKRIKGFLETLRISKIELLPYHKMGENKYRALGRSMKSFFVPSKENLDKIKFIIEE